MIDRIEKSLKAKLFILLFGLNLTVILVVGAISYHSTRLALTAQLEANLSVIASQLTENVDRYLSERLNDTRAIALHYSLFNLKTTTSSQNAVLARYLQIYPYYENINIINVEDIRMPDGKGSGYKQAWYMPAVRGQTTSSDMLVSEYSGEPTMSFASPLRDDDGNVVSVLTTNLKLEYLWDIVDHVRKENETAGSSGYAFMVNAGGVLIAYPDEGKVLSENYLKSGDASLKEAVKNMTLGRSGTASYRYNGETMFAAYSPCTGFGEYAGHGWSLAVTYPEAEVFSPLNRLLTNYMLIFLLSSLAALLVSTQLANYLVRPILSLKEGAAIIGSGDFGMRIPVKTSDELGELAGSFNEMARTLQARDEQISEYTSTLKDINNELSLKQRELSHANEVLTRTNEELKLLEQQKSEFTEMLTHDIKSPLSTIITYTDMILGNTITGEGEDMKKAISSINASAFKILSLTDNFLTSSSIESGRLQLSLKRMDINEFVDDEIPFFKPRIDKKNIRFSYTTSKGLPPVKADAVQLDRAFSNIMSNAIKFTPNGGEITLVTEKEGPWVKVSVSDTGRGIPENELEELFKKFRRSKSAEKVEGLGLGLFITKAIIDGHKGRVVVQSVPGSGSTFSIYLPEYVTAEDR